MPANTWQVPKKYFGLSKRVLTILVFILCIRWFKDFHHCGLKSSEFFKKVKDFHEAQKEIQDELFSTQFFPEPIWALQRSLCLYIVLGSYLEGGSAALYSHLMNNATNTVSKPW